MIVKLPLLGFALVTAVSSQALAHESHGSRHRPTGYDARTPAPVAVDLRYADLNRDGWVTMQEALDTGRQVFRRRDRDNDRVLDRREADRAGFRREDRNYDGRVSMREYQRAVRAHFARLDTNRDGYLGRYELGYTRARAPRPAGWHR
jgi:hypothetical protein